MQSCSAKFYNEYSSQFFPSNSASHAILSLLELLLAVFEKGNQSQIQTVQSFRDSLLIDKPLIQNVLFSIDSSMSPDVQTTSVEFMRFLFGNSPAQMEVLDADVKSSLLRSLRGVYTNCINF